MPQLRPVPDAQPRALGIIRVSKERDEMISPEIQRTAIEDHCARSGYVLADVVEALDESGSQRRSPWWRKLDEAVSRIEDGQFDVIVVWKFSRAARQRLRWAVALDRVEVAGGRLESATEPLDVSTSAGRLARGVLAEFNAFESERIGDGWREAHARRTSRGLPANGKPRFGYRSVDGMHRPLTAELAEQLGEPVAEAEVVVDLYRRYIAGESQYSLAAWLNRNRIRTVPGYTAKGPGPWSINGLRQMLDSGFAAGLITVRGDRQPGAHEPVIDQATWEAYLATRELRRPLRRAERSPYLLSAMVWCACGSKMGYGTYGRTSHAQLRCHDSTRPGADRHAGAYVRAAPVEDGVHKWLKRLAARVDADTNTALAQQARATVRRVDAKTLARQIIELDKAIGRLTANHAKGLVPDVAYSPALGELTGEREQLEQRRTVAAAEATLAAPSTAAAALLQDWDVLPVEQRRSGLRRLLGTGRVVVTGWADPIGVQIVSEKSTASR